MPTSAPASPVGDFASLVERTDHLHALRAGYACIVLGASALRLLPEDGSLHLAALITAGYLVAAVVSEWLRRGLGARALWAIGGMLLVDGVYLAWAAYLSGGAESPIRFLIYVHIVAGTLLASFRTGLKLAVWHTLLFFVVLYGQAGGLLGIGSSDPSTLPGGARFGWIAVWSVTALWGMALGTAAFASVVERELRRQKVELLALASMAAEIERGMKPSEIGGMLLERLSASFGFSRGIVLASPTGELSPLSQHRAANPSLPIANIDPLVARAWSTREVVLVKRLDPSTNPGLAGALPDARNLLVVPLFAEGRPVGVVALERARGARHIRRWVVSMVHQFASHAALALRNAWLLEEVQRMADTDPLTGLSNRRVFEKALQRELARAGRTGQQVSLLILDADHFKEYNDRFGHQAGDEVLRSLGRALVEHARGFDTIARYGGEEFAVILTECPVEEARAVAERLRLVGSALDGKAPITLSGGVATYPVHAGDAASLVEAADAALYASKRAGRDRLSLPGDEPDALTTAGLHGR